MRYAENTRKGTKARLAIKALIVLALLVSNSAGAQTVGECQSIDLIWSAVTKNEVGGALSSPIAKYEVVVGRDATFANPVVLVEGLNLSTRYATPECSAGDEYYFYVRAVDQANRVSARSIVVNLEHSGSTVGLIELLWKYAAAPTGLAATERSDSVQEVAEQCTVETTTTVTRTERCVRSGN